MNGKEDEIRLLLVDDEAEFLESMAKALSQRGFVVRTAHNGTLALWLLKVDTFDVAVLDVKMPGIPGDQLFRDIKKRRPKMPVIMLTGHGTVQQAFQTSREGVFEYLTKPCDVEKLARVARNAVKAYKQAGITELGMDEDEEIRLLIVDDEQELLESLPPVLSRRGMRIATARTSLEALDLIEKQVFDVALLDAKMPIIDGVNLLSLIRKELPLCEVILYAGQPSNEAAAEGARAGAFEYLEKPQDADVLTATIRKAFRRNRSRTVDAAQNQIDQMRGKRGD